VSREPTLRALTPSQTVGPFFHDCLLGAGSSRSALAGENAQGQRIEVHGYVLDGDGVAVPDAVLELWQADSNGVYHNPADARWSGGSDFPGFGRVGTDEHGRFEFNSVLPGRVPGDGGHHAPHICVAIFARGLLNHLFTRMYFPDEPSNDADATLLRVPTERRQTLVARAVPQPAPRAARSYRFDIVLQGRDETAFFAIA
jgi:protocatechuate 3,4-dioxygenase alpha subunit